VTVIAADARVSRDTVYRWLRQDGVLIGRNGHVEQAHLSGDGLSRISDELAELRREQSFLVARIARLEGLIEALVSIKRSPLDEQVW
jgi:hypothetical protein